MNGWNQEELLQVSENISMIYSSFLSPIAITPIIGDAIFHCQSGDPLRISSIYISSFVPKFMRGLQKSCFFIDNYLYIDVYLLLSTSTFNGYIAHRELRIILFIFDILRHFLYQFSF